MAVEMTTLNAKQFFKDAMTVISRQKRNDRSEDFFSNQQQLFEAWRRDVAHQKRTLNIQNLNNKFCKNWKL